MTVAATTTVGTVSSDFIDRTLKLGYLRSSALLLALVVAVLVVWRKTTGRITTNHITTRRDEIFYWLTILASNTLGTALEDFTADRSGLDLAVITFVALLHRLESLPQSILFWVSYILTRPLGATLGDTFTKTHAQGGFAAGRISASLVIAAAMVLFIAVAPRREKGNKIRTRNVSNNFNRNCLSIMLASILSINCSVSHALGSGLDTGLFLGPQA